MALSVSLPCHTLWQAFLLKALEPLSSRKKTAERSPQKRSRQRACGQRPPVASNSNEITGLETAICATKAEKALDDWVIFLAKKMAKQDHDASLALEL